MFCRKIVIAVLAIASLLSLSAPSNAIMGGSCSGCGGGNLADLINSAINEMLFSLGSKAEQDPDKNYPISIQYDPMQSPITIDVGKWDHSFNGAMMRTGNNIFIQNPALGATEETECRGDADTGLVGCVLEAFHGKPAPEVCEMLTHEAARTFAGPSTDGKIPPEIENRYLVSQAILEKLKDDSKLFGLCQQISDLAQQLWAQEQAQTGPKPSPCVQILNDIADNTKAYTSATQGCQVLPHSSAGYTEAQHLARSIELTLPYYVSTCERVCSDNPSAQISCRFVTLGGACPEN